MCAERGEQAQPTQHEAYNIQHAAAHAEVLHAGDRKGCDAQQRGTSSSTAVRFAALSQMPRPLWPSAPKEIDSSMKTRYLVRLAQSYRQRFPLFGGDTAHRKVLPKAHAYVSARKRGRGEGAFL